MTDTPTPGDYRIFLAAYIGDDHRALREKIQALREELDPTTAAMTGPHVTVWGLLWRTGPATAENESALISQLDRAAGTFPSFQMTLGGIDTFRNRVLFLDAPPAATYQPVRDALIAAIGPDPHGFHPHLTLAMRRKPAEIASEADRLRATPWHTRRETVPVRELHLMQRAPSESVWRSIHTVPLRG